MKTLILSLVLNVAVAAVFAAEEAKPAAKAAYENDFEKAEADKVPEDMMVLDGAWAVKAQDGNKFLELPGAPLDTFGVLFGPAEKENVAVAARAFGTSQGRRQPVFGVSLGGVGGFKFLVAPAKRVLELWKGDDLLTNAPCAWESGAWTRVKLQVRKVKDTEWAVESKAWKEGSAEPVAWQMVHTERTEPTPGRAAVWGSPQSGTPIRFDDLKVTVVK